MPRQRALRLMFQAFFSSTANRRSFFVPGASGWRQPACLQRSRLQRNVVGQDHRPFAQHECPLNDMLQFTYIARPAVAHENIHDLCGDAHDGLGILPVEFDAEVLDQQRDIVHALPQRWHMDVHDVEPVIEILAEGTFGDGFSEVAMGGGHDAHIHLTRCCLPHPLDLLFFQYAQELELDQGRNIPDLVQQNGPAVGSLKPAYAFAVRPGEGALGMAEKAHFPAGFRPAPNS